MVDALGLFGGSESDGLVGKPYSGHQACHSGTAEMSGNFSPAKSPSRSQIVNHSHEAGLVGQMDLDP